MADRCLMITWGAVSRGREERAVENFNDAVGYYGRCQQEGKIESFDVVLCAPNEALDGYIRLDGTAKQLADLKEDREYQRLLVVATLTTDRLSVADGFCNEGIAQQMEIFEAEVSKVPQMS
jgi:hypothetical protein